MKSGHRREQHGELFNEVTLNRWRPISTASEVVKQKLHKIKLTLGASGSNSANCDADSGRLEVSVPQRRESNHEKKVDRL